MENLKALLKDQNFKDLLRYIKHGLLVTVCLVLLKIYIEHLPIGHKLELLAGELLQDQLSAVDEDKLPVVVVDISKMRGGKAGEATPRDQLKALTEAIAREHPRAIAIDIDFSPDGQGWIVDDDDQFFDHCLWLKKMRGVPIFLGVHRTMAEPAYVWLGAEEYQGLAVALIAYPDTTRLPLWMQVKGETRLPTLSTALAEAYRGGRLPEPPKLIRWAIETRTERHADTDYSSGPQLIMANALVNYSKLEAIKLSTLPIISPESIAESGRLFKDKMVIIGDVDKATERYNVIGREETVPGVYLHACAAYTLVKEPLYELNQWVRIFLDFLISGLLIGSVAWFRYRHHQDHHSQEWRNRRAKFICWAVPIILLVGLSMVRLLGILWLDFILVVFALLLHPGAETRLESFWKKEGEQEAGAVD
ncbi:MAG TPA: CHASE2 domain-containing protein [Pyrinomonadaceae bacterium]|jgi:CHASE2 domain-containing sensor protein|nr:CHASE2 domain-containing protein [Pyrinomonadaceae bacterium]